MLTRKKNTRTQRNAAAKAQKQASSRQSRRRPQKSALLLFLVFCFDLLAEYNNSAVLLNVFFSCVSAVCRVKKTSQHQRIFCFFGKNGHLKKYIIKTIINFLRIFKYASIYSNQKENIGKYENKGYRKGLNA